MSAKPIAAYFDEFKTEAFRLEALPFYRTPLDMAEFDRYLGGELFPSWNDRPWLQRIRDAKAEGREFRRVRLVTRVLPAYVRFEIEWGYPGLAEAGEDILVLEPGRDVFEEAEGIGDFWLFDTKTPFRMRYAPDGSFINAEETPKEASFLSDLRARLVDQALPLAEYLAKMRSVDLPVEP